MTEPAQHPMNPEQEIRLHAINLATALHKDAFRIREAENADPGDAVVRDAARFAAFIADGSVSAPGAPAANSGESAGATTAVDA